MANDLARHLETNEALWQRWLDFGITPGNEFEIEFHFYTSEENSADALIHGLEKAGLSAKKEATRTLIIIKGWLITVPMPHAWTLEALNEQTRRFCKLADMLHLTYEGCGAYMPWQGQQPPPRGSHF